MEGSCKDRRIAAEAVLRRSAEMASAKVMINPGASASGLEHRSGSIKGERLVSY